MMLDMVTIKPKYSIVKIICIAISVILTILLIVFTIFCINANNIRINSINAEIEHKMSEKETMKRSIIWYRNVMDEKTWERMDNIWIADEGKRVFLTFDDGPSEKVTPQILDILQKENIKATFFVLGSRVEFYPEILKRVYKEGHYIANHGYTHKYDQIYNSTQSVLDEYNRTEQAIKTALEKPEYDSHLFRFPGGSTGGRYKDLKNEAKQLLRQNNIAHIDWNALTGDAEGKKTKEEMLEYVKQTMGTKQNIIILMHDAGDKQVTADMLPELIAYLREQGYEFKNFSDIIK